MMQNNQFLQLPNQNQSPNFGGGAPALSLDKAQSSYTYASKRARKQHWFNQMKHNKKLETEMLLKNYKLDSPSRSFLITLCGVSGVPLNANIPEQAPIQGSKFHVEYYMTLFNSELGSHGSFYGRTYRSQPIEINGSSIQIDTKQEDYVYFHTSYTEKTSKLVVEVVIVREFSGQKTYSSAGFALCPIFEFGGKTLIELTKGSPRSIAQTGHIPQGKSPGRFQYEIRDFAPIDPLKILIPKNCFCSPHDVVPGLIGDKPPLPRSPNKNIGENIKCELMKKENIHIHNIQVITSIAFESRFENFLRRMKQEKMRTARGHIHGGVDNVYISERRILVSANNSWQNICTESQSTLNPPNENGISISGGSITLKNFICHPLVALVFRIEYKAMLPSEKGNDSFYFTIGWTYHVPTFNNAGGLQDETIEADVELGPGCVPSGELLWDPNAEDINYYQIKLKAVVSANSIAPNELMDQSYIPNRQNALNQQHHQNHNQRPMIQQPNAINNLDNPAMAQQHNQIRQLELQLQHQAKLKQEADARFEMLEIQRQKDLNANHQINPNDAMERKYREEQRLLQLQKNQVQQELELMRKNMRDYQDSLKQAAMSQTQNMMQGYQQPYMYQQQYPGQGGYNTQQMYNENHPQNSQQQIAMIGNVFYNMLNMIGETERDRRIVGLSDKLKKMIQNQKFDDLLAPKAPFVGAGMINLLRTTDLPLSDQVNIMKLGQGDLLQHPTAQITSDSIYKDVMSLEVEAQDELKASTIRFKFLCYKSAVNSIEIPNKLYFQFKFFTFPSLISDKVKIVHAPGQENYIRHGQVFYLQKEHPGANKSMNAGTQLQKQLITTDTLHDPNLLESIFEIDPSLSKIKNENMKLAGYLRERFLTVDVFDGETLFLFGTCKIPLYELLRQGRQTIVRAKECEMCDPDTGEFRGSIQLIMSNQGKYVSIKEIYDHKMDTLNMRDGSPTKSRLQPSQNDPNKQSKYRKVIKSKPMDLTKIQQTNNETSLLATHVGMNTNYNQSIISQMSHQQLSAVQQQNADLRKKLRVDRVRKMTIGHSEASAAYTQVDDPSQPDWAKHKSLKEIEVIRETKRDQVLSKVLEEYTQTTEQVSVVPGQIEFYKCKIQNPFNSREVFSIHINDPDERLLSQPELCLVNDPLEWRHWVKQGKGQAPFSYDIIQRPADIILNPMDEVELLFKFMTTRDVSIDPNELASQDIIKPRKIGIIIMQTNRKPHLALELNVVPSSAIIDHTFRFYEPQNSHVTLQIPPFLQLYQQGLFAIASKPNVVVDINRDTSGFQVEAQTSDAPYEVDIIIFVYGDQYREKLLATCLIEIYSMKTLYTKIKAGVQSTQSLELTADNARQVLIHSSNPKIVYMPRREIGRPLKIVPQMVNHISICAKTYLPTTQRVRVNCTDMNSGELVYQWLMIIDADQPKVHKNEMISTKINFSSTHDMFFENRLENPAIYEFATSRPDLIQIIHEKLEYKPRETRKISLNILPQSRFGVIDVFLFANDLDYQAMQCIKLSITYLELP
ncbi:UNKNOWN [Stylonychia lemnae]|uniref:Nephrocystin-4 n=1 Tax=Stylonychia lemnae TaxID=5949 RepID=A0A077ZPM7_STYLE|nr:UNKNOWN [Stylonychia lemnae]|eukprot:CDW71325.1 UNKNOWN [Stylonychia lemnae]